MSRQPNRTSNQVQNDVVATRSIVREDVYDLISSSETIEDAAVAVADFINGLPEGTLSDYQKTNQEIIDRIVSDLPSYRKWS